MKNNSVKDIAKLIAEEFNIDSDFNDSIFFTSIDVDKNIQKIAYDCSKISKIINQTTDEEYQGCDSLKAN